jgi:MFS family permease
VSAPPETKLTLRAFWESLPTPARWALSTTAIQTLGRGMVLPFTIIYLTEVRHVPLDTAGVLMGLIAVVALLVTAPSGSATDRYGPRRVLIAATTASVLSPLVMGFGTTVPVFVVAICLMGFGWGLSRAAWNTLIASVIRGPARQQFYGVNFALVNLGIGLGGVVSGFLVDVHRPVTFTTIFVVDAICMLVPLALLLGPLRREGGPVPVPEDLQTPASYRALVKIPAVLWLSGLTFLTTFVGYGQMESGFPAFARQTSEVSTRVLGFAFAANTLAIVLLQFTVLKWAVGRRRTRILMTMSVIWAAAWLVLGSTGLVSGQLAAVVGVIAFMAVFGFGETMMQATIPAIVNDLADDHTRGRANSVNSGAFQLGAILGPVLAGYLLHAGHWVAFIATMVLGCAVVALSALGIERIVTPEVNGLATSAGVDPPRP